MPASLRPSGRSQDLIASSVSSAIHAGLFSQVRYLLELGHSASSSDSQGRTPLSLCSLVEDERWALSLARLLLEKGAAVGQTDQRGLNALHYACLYARTELIPVLLAAADIDLNAGDRNGNSALLYAARTGDLSLLSLMIAALKRFDLPLDRANRLGVTPLMQAWRSGHLEAGKLLLKEGADPTRVDAAGRSCRSYEAAARAANERRESDAAARRMMLSLRLDDSAGWRKYRSLRAKSAPNGERHSWHDLMRQRRMDESVAQRQDKDLIRPAGELDARNDPQRVFETDPADFFDRRPRPPRPLTAHHARRRLPATARASQPDVNWRGEVSRLYRQYECQCSQSYRDTARPPSPAQSVNVVENGKDLLGLCAESFLDFGGHSRSRRGSAMSQRSFMSRDPRKLGKSRKGSASRQSMESVLEDEDLQMLSQAQRTRKRPSIDGAGRNLPRAIGRPVKQSE